MTEIYEKRGHISEFNPNSPISIDLGCGPNKCSETAIGIDALDYPGVDIVGDIFDVLAQIPEGVVQYAYSAHFFEHIEDLTGLLTQLDRVMMPGATLDITVPHFANPYYYSDYTHKKFFGLYTFSYFAKNAFFRRKVPKYDVTFPFDIQSVELIFKSTPPFYFRHAFKKIQQYIFNSCNYMRELHEELFCYSFPPYEIRFILKKTG